MRILLWSGWKGRGVELTSDLVELGEDDLVESVEAATLGGGELFGKRKRRKLVQGHLKAAQLCLELAGAGRAGRIGSGSVALERRAQELLAIGLVGHAIRLDEPQRLARRQAVAVEDGQTGGLVSLSHGRQRMGKRGADAAAGEPVLGLWREPASDGEAPIDPGRPSPQNPRHLHWRVVVLVDQGADHSRLVESCRGPRGSVRREQQPLLLGSRERRLEDDRHEAAALLAPARKPLEAVENLVGSRLLCWGDPQGKLLQAVPRDPADPRAELGVAGPQLLDGEKADARSGLFGAWQWGRARDPRHDVLARPELAGGRCLTTRNRVRPCHGSGSIWICSSAPTRSLGVMASPGFGDKPAAR